MCNIKYIIHYIGIVFAFSANREVFGDPFRWQTCKQFHYYNDYSDDCMQYCSDYKYLGLVLNEFLDYNMTAKSVAYYQLIER